MARILVADDNVANRDLVRTVLGYRGHEVVEAADGIEALRIIRAMPVDLVIVDVLMPGMDGYELVREIRSNPAIADTRVLFYTANYLEEEARPMAAALGVNHILMKAGDPKAISDTVDEVLAEAPTVSASSSDEEFSREHLRVINAKLLAKIEELEQKERLHQLVDAAVSVGHELSEPATLQRIANAARSLVDGRHAWLQLLDDNGIPTACAHAAKDGDDARCRCYTESWADGSPEMVAVGIPSRERIAARLYVEGPARGGSFTINDTDLLKALTAAAGRAIENARLYERARRREAWLSASVDVTTALLSSDPTDTLTIVARGARRVMDADGSWIVLPTGIEDIVVAASDGPLAESLHKRTLPLSEATIAREVLSTGLPMVLDESNAPWQPRSLVRDSVGAGPILAAPLVAGGDIIGVLIIGNTQGGTRFSDVDVEMASSFAAHAALAIEFGRVTDDRQRLALLEERDRIARDLHDIVIQRIFAVGLRLEGLRSRVSEAHDAVLASSTSDLDDTIADIRRAIFSLRAHTAEQSSLRGLVIKTVENAAELLGFAPQLVIEGPVDAAVPEHVHHHVLATLGEALSNAARHADATSVRVLVRADRDMLVLRVSDNGRGLPPHRRESGLANLASRATELGGSMTISSGPDGLGTVLDWAVPLSDAESGAPVYLY